MGYNRQTKIAVNTVHRSLHIEDFHGSLTTLCCCMYYTFRLEEICYDHNNVSFFSFFFFQPHLHEIVNRSMELACTSKEPYNYFLLLRALFRSIGGGTVNYTIFATNTTFTVSLASNINK